MELLDPIELAEVLGYADRELSDVVLLRVFFAQHVPEKWLQVSVFREPAGGALDGSHITVDAQLHPLQPYVLIANGVDELALLVTQEVIHAEDQRRTRQLLAEVQVVLYILTQRDGDEVLKYGKEK